MSGEVCRTCKGWGWVYTRTPRWIPRDGRIPPPRVPCPDCRPASRPTNGAASARAGRAAACEALAELVGTWSFLALPEHVRAAVLAHLREHPSPPSPAAPRPPTSPE
jgi:hypothetical protein